MFCRRLVSLAIAASLVARTTLAFAAMPVFFTGLNNPADPAWESIANGVNSSGEVVGTYALGSAGIAQSPGNNAFVWNQGTISAMPILGTGPGGTFGYGQAINDSGITTGALTDANLNRAAYAWDGNAAHNPMTLYGSSATSNWAYAINNAGVIGGVSPYPSDATIWWSSSSSTDLRPALVATLSAGTGPEKVTGLNSTVAVGQYGQSFYTKGFVYNLGSGALTNVPTLGGNNCYPWAVNAGGLVVGSASEGTTMGKAIRAMKYDGITITDLGAISEGVNTDGTTNYSKSEAKDVNSAGTIVGYSYLNGGADGETHAFIWDSAAGMRDLNTLYAGSIPAGWTLNQATGINDSGTICGTATDAGGLRHAYAFTPAMPGDANLDKVVDISDLSKVLTNYDKAGMTWADGDFDGSGSVDINDLSKVLANYDKSMAAGFGPGLKAVPEPAGLVLLATALFGLLAYGWRNRK